MKSRILRAKVSHIREAGRHRFVYNVFYLMIDLLRIDTVIKPILLLAHNSPNVFSLNSKDYIDFGKSTIAANFTAWLQTISPGKELEELYLITHPRTFGYSFNPISIFLYRLKGHSRLSVATEVDNTFGEAKMFALGSLDDQGVLHHTLPKNFYVSPFIPLDTQFNFYIKLSETSLSVRIDSLKADHLYLRAMLNGEFLPLTNKNLIMSFIKNPHITAKVIGGIHFEALRLYLKRIPIVRKASDRDLQRDYYDRKHYSKHIS